MQIYYRYLGPEVMDLDRSHIKVSSLIKGWSKQGLGLIKEHRVRLKRKDSLISFELDDIVTLNERKMNIENFGSSLSLDNFLASSKPRKRKRRQIKGLKSVISKRLLEDYYEPRYRVRFTPKRERMDRSITPDYTGWTVVEKAEPTERVATPPAVVKPLTPKELWDKFIREKNERLARSS